MSDENPRLLPILLLAWLQDVLENSPSDFLKDNIDTTLTLLRKSHRQIDEEDRIALIQELEGGALRQWLLSRCE